MQRYVVGHPIIFRRGETKVKNLGLQTYQGFPEINRMYYSSSDCYYFDADEGTLEGIIEVGAKSIELNSGSKPDSPFQAHNALPYFRLLNDVNSYQWVVIRMAEEVNYSVLCDNLASNNMFEPGDDEKQNMKFYLDDRYDEMSVYPFVYEWTQSGSDITAQKLTTYSEYNPTTAMGDRHQGMETVRMYSTGQFHGISSSWANKLKTAWLAYTPQITGGQLRYGFLMIARGGNTANITTRNLIRWFLQRCSNIDTTNDWTHIQLT